MKTEESKETNPEVNCTYFIEMDYIPPNHFDKFFTCTLINENEYAYLFHFHEDGVQRWLGKGKRRGAASGYKILEKIENYNVSNVEGYVYDYKMYNSTSCCKGTDSENCKCKS